MINKMQNHLERNIHILAGFVDWTDEMESVYRISLAESFIAQQHCKVCERRIPEFVNWVEHMGSYGHIKNTLQLVHKLGKAEFLNTYGDMPLLSPQHIRKPAEQQFIGELAKLWVDVQENKGAFKQLAPQMVPAAVPVRLCLFGATCHRKNNPMHNSRFAHPPEGVLYKKICPKGPTCKQKRIETHYRAWGHLGDKNLTPDPKTYVRRKFCKLTGQTFVPRKQWKNMRDEKNEAVSEGPPAPTGRKLPAHQQESLHKPLNTSMPAWPTKMTAPPSSDEPPAPAPVPPPTSTVNAAQLLKATVLMTRPPPPTKLPPGTSAVTHHRLSAPVSVSGVPPPKTQYPDLSQPPPNVIKPGLPTMRGPNPGPPVVPRPILRPMGGPLGIRGLNPAAPGLMIPGPIANLLSAWMRPPTSNSVSPGFLTPSAGHVPRPVGPPLRPPGGILPTPGMVSSVLPPAVPTSQSTVKTMTPPDLSAKVSPVPTPTNLLLSTAPWMAAGSANDSQSTLSIPTSTAPVPKPQTYDMEEEERALYEGRDDPDHDRLHPALRSSQVSPGRTVSKRPYDEVDRKNESSRKDDTDRHKPPSPKRRSIERDVSQGDWRRNSHHSSPAAGRDLASTKSKGYGDNRHDQRDRDRAEWPELRDRNRDERLDQRDRDKGERRGPPRGKDDRHDQWDRNRDNHRDQRDDRRDQRDRDRDDRRDQRGRDRDDRIDQRDRDREDRGSSRGSNQDRHPTSRLRPETYRRDDKREDGRRPGSLDRERDRGLRKLEERWDKLADHGTRGSPSGSHHSRESRDSHQEHRRTSSPNSSRHSAQSSSRKMMDFSDLNKEKAQPQMEIRGGYDWRNPRDPTKKGGGRPPTSPRRNDNSRETSDCKTRKENHLDDAEYYEAMDRFLEEEARQKQREGSGGIRHQASSRSSPQSERKQREEERTRDRPERRAAQDDSSKSGLQGWMKAKLIDIMPPQFAADQVEDFYWLLVDNLQILITNYKETEGYSAEELLQAMSDEDKEHVMQIQSMTGVNDLTTASRLIYVLRGMDETIVGILGCLDIQLLQSMVASHPPLQAMGFTIKNVFSCLGISQARPDPTDKCGRDDRRPEKRPTDSRDARGSDPKYSRHDNSYNKDRDHGRSSHREPPSRSIEGHDRRGDYREPRGERDNRPRPPDRDRPSYSDRRPDSSKDSDISRGRPSDSSNRIHRDREPRREPPEDRDRPRSDQYSNKPTSDRRSFSDSRSERDLHDRSKDYDRYSGHSKRY